MLSESAGRALGAVVNKMKVCPELSFDIFTKLYDSMVEPVLFYAAGVWGFEDSPEGNTVQSRAMRYFLGVHRFTTRAAIEGDMGWEPCVVKQRVEVLRLWNRLVHLPEERLTRKVFNWDRAHRHPWSKEVLEILTAVNLQTLFLNSIQCKITNVRQTLFNTYKEQWKLKSLQKPKLRSYVQFKENFFTEPYVKFNLKRRQVSVCSAQSRSAAPRGGSGAL